MADPIKYINSSNIALYIFGLNMTNVLLEGLTRMSLINIPAPRIRDSFSFSTTTRTSQMSLGTVSRSTAADIREN